MCKNVFDWLLTLLLVGWHESFTHSLKKKKKMNVYHKCVLTLQVSWFIDSLSLFTETSQESQSHPTLLSNLVSVYMSGFTALSPLLPTVTIFNSRLKFFWVTEDGPSFYISDVPHQSRGPPRPSSGTAWTALCECQRRERSKYVAHLNGNGYKPCFCTPFYRWSCGMTKWAISWLSTSFKP